MNGDPKWFTATHSQHISIVSCYCGLAERGFTHYALTCAAVNIDCFGSNCSTSVPHPS